ncbi:MAG: endonuclease V [Promethearchaeota archaeon]
MYNLNLELLKLVNSTREAENIQEKYSQVIKNSNLNSKDLFLWDSINYVVAIDISYFNRDNTEYGVACAVLWDFKLNEIAQHALLHDIMDFPYTPGLLGFREVPLMVKTMQKIKIKPDIIICDGHGIIHPRRFGEATHIGYALNIPSIGIAKNPFIGKSPVFISIGYRIEIELAIKIALYLSKEHKQPEPLYLADRISRDYIKSL